jgi:hypothetical protein
MRKILFSFVIVITACSNAPVHSAPMEKSASLILKRSTEPLRPNHSGGIFAVDGHPVDARHRYELLLPPGNHKIAYLCPGWMYVDGFPIRPQKFIAGKNYELSCPDGIIQIKLVDGA